LANQKKKIFKISCETADLAEAHHTIVQTAVFN
jgi:hypothetical protein